MMTEQTTGENLRAADIENPNANCVCTGPGHCARHGVEKSRLEFNFCAGIGCTAQQCARHFAAWEQGRKPGQKSAVAEPLPALLPARRRQGLGDLIADGIQAVTFGLVKPCGGCKQRQEWLNRKVPFTSRSPFSGDPHALPEFVTTAQFTQDILALASKLPANTSRIVGIARSGLAPATLIAEYLHRPISILRQSNGDIIDGGNGWRLTGNTSSDGPVVLIDDTTLTGNSFKQCLPIAQKAYPHVVAAAVYVSPSAQKKPDLWARDLPWPHLLEWNLFNSILSPQAACDFDGILCRDCPADSDDDGPRYADFLANAQPLYLTRRAPIPLIVTARLECYRPQTLDWLKRHGISFGELVMGPWSSLKERRRSDVAAWKAGHFAKFLKRRHKLQPPMFIESDARQAQRIAEMTRGLVVCPAAGRCFR